MNEGELRKLREKLRAAMPPQKPAELNRDLWPDFLRKTNETHVRVPWVDWALAAIAVVALILFPGVIPALLYHL